MQKPQLRQQYGTLWDEIADLRTRMREVYPTVMALAMGGSIRSQTLSTAAQMLQYAQASLGGVPDSMLQQLRAGIEAREINPDLDAHILEAQIGDVITIELSDNTRKTLTVTGTVHNPRFPSPEVLGYTSAAISPEGASPAMAGSYS